jgi:hypothetical protein
MTELPMKVIAAKGSPVALQLTHVDRNRLSPVDGVGF